MPTLRFVKSLGIPVLAALLATACGGGPQLPTFTPSPADTIRILRPGDVVRVQVFGHDETTGEFPVDENSNLLLPIVGEFSVAGMTVPELRARIKREFNQLYTQSFVAVTPLFRVSVLGEVSHPGLYSVDATMTVYQVLALAGGTTRNARESQMRLIRDNQQVQLPVNAGSLATATLREIGVRSGDQVIVPRKSITYETWLVGLQALNLALLAYTIFR